ncbi:glycoside hydrolase/phage tail family protein [Methylobacterium sp. J-068]|uniref:baseplate multidomain protein megatron n=1 Tax=Methylobacterium sp. J-068 TaxID=2836649 RepID=UPI001FB9E6C4|nr:glycoside hydrolase/phage tail family protein [Methylobacterium sp. J-068]MCJ2033286.1 glycoside hydrolase/phage tail family protein [Methylobacterium sp. J-068]
MATLILQTAGAAVGTALGGPIGGIIGSAVGAAAGSGIDSAIFGGGGTRRVEGPRLSDVAGLSSTEGDPIPRVYGRARIGGTLIWATRPLEVASTSVERAAGAKGGGGGKTVRTAYAYFADLAIGLCEGEIAGIRRVWADGLEIDLTTLALRLHRGGTDQAPDPLIVAKEGEENAPAYRGLAYVVFERLALDAFGNRIPQFAFEVIRPVAGLAAMIRAVCLIPGSTEFGLDPLRVTEDAGYGTTRPANRFQLQANTDVVASLDALQALCPRLTRISVVASWFGDDLRAGQCTIAPKVDNATKITTGDAWSVAGFGRSAAGTVSTAPGGGPAYGGTPSDAGLGRLVAELRRRGLGVVLYPFVMMDVPVGNALADPRGAAHQPPYPWRGRITCHPAPGRPGSPDGTEAAEAQVAAFFEGYRAFVLHYADLAATWAAEGVDLAGFIVGSEFVGLTRVRGGFGSYPAVARLRALANDVRGRLGPGVALVYAADWTEYGADVRDGGATIRFPLDALFADPAIDAVGIDYYPPLTDWRDGADHADLALADDIYDRAYLKGRVGAGEAFDWYYRDASDRAAQIRTPIGDGAYAKPWIHRAKDLVAWWSNPHVEREGGVETRATAWVPRGKPIWLTEIGVPAVDKGTNGPNVFPDPKSSEDAAPPHSRGTRDDLIQARGLAAILARFDPGLPGFEADHNPVSPLYGGTMVPADAIFVWAWDARPYPAFPDFDTVWSDAGNWPVGHWITGRIEGLELDRLIAAILSDLGIGVPAAITADAFLDGYVIDRPMSARAALEPLAQLYGLDVSALAGTLSVQGPRREVPRVIEADDLALVRPEDAPLTRVRAEEAELPRSIEIGFTDGQSAEYRRAGAAAIRPTGARRRETRMEAAIVTRRDCAEALAEAALDAALAARDTARFRLSPRRIDLAPGDLLALPGERLPHRIMRIADSPQGRDLETRGVPLHGRAPRPTDRAEARPRRAPPTLAGPPFAVALDLPADRGTPTPLQVLAVTADPWPGAVAVWRAEGEAAPLSPTGFVDHPACLGETLTALPPGPLWRFDRNARLDVRLRQAGALGAIDERAALAGGNLFALRGADGAIELFSAAGITLIGPETFRLTRLLRGLAGGEAQAERAAPAGSLIVRLDAAVVPLVERLDEAGRAFRYRVGPAERDPADPAFVALTARAGLEAFRPLRPVHLRARREPEGVRLTWIRRARRDGDSWDLAEIPLEEAESYVVEVFSADGTRLRVLTAEGPNLLYAKGDETADFGGPQERLDFGVAQVGALAGRGPATRTRVPVRTP